jgi:hypothetical protein
VLRHCPCSSSGEHLDEFMLPGVSCIPHILLIFSSPPSQCSFLFSVFLTEDCGISFGLFHLVTVSLQETFFFSLYVQLSFLVKILFSITSVTPSISSYFYLPQLQISPASYSCSKHYCFITPLLHQSLLLYVPPDSSLC